MLCADCRDRSAMKRNMYHVLLLQPLLLMQSVGQLMKSQLYLHVTVIIICLRRLEFLLKELYICFYACYLYIPWDVQILRQREAVLRHSRIA
jgi:hypothetical protein